MLCYSVKLGRNLYRGLESGRGRSRAVSCAEAFTAFLLHFSRRQICLLEGENGVTGEGELR